MSAKSRQSKAEKEKFEAQLAQFCGVTGASTRDAKNYLTHFKRMDVAVDEYFRDPTQLAARGAAPEQPAASTSKLNTLFDTYKDSEGDEIKTDGTMAWFEELGVPLDDQVVFALALELKSPSMGVWPRDKFTDGWKKLGADSIQGMKPVISRLRTKMTSDPTYFQQVYNYTFEFGKTEGARSISLETAQAFWELLIPFGLKGGALSHIPSGQDDDEDDAMNGVEDGWNDKHTKLWLEYLTEKGGKGVSKDTWTMFLEFVRSIDAKFKTFDAEGSWPSAIDEFVEWAKGRV